MAMPLQGLLADKDAEVVGDSSGNGLHSWLAVSPASDADDSGSVGMPAPAQAPSQEAAPAAAPAQVLPIPIFCILHLTSESRPAMLGSEGTKSKMPSVV